MTVITLRPNGVASSHGTLVVNPSGTADVVLADDDDATSVSVTQAIDDSAQLLLDLDTFTLPAGAVIKSVAARVRSRITSGSNTIIAALQTADGGSSGLVPQSVAFTTVIAFTSVYSYAQSDIDGAQLRLSLPARFTNSTTVEFAEAYVDVTYVLQPVVTVDAPSGTVSDTNTPEVTWTPALDPAGGDQTAYEVKIFNAAQYGAGGFDPATSTPYSTTGVVTSSATNVRPIAVQLPNDDYRAYVRVAQSVNNTLTWSDWEDSAFTVDAPTPSVPLLTLTAEDIEGRIRIDLDGQAGDATTDLLEIQRSNDNLTWSALRLTTDTDGVITGDTATVWDLEAGNGETTYYRARALHDSGEVYTYSDWIVGVGTWTSTEWWLKAPQHPSLNTPAVVHSQPSYQRPARQGVFQALSARNAIVVSDTRGADRGTIVLRLDTDVEATAIDDLIDYGGVLLLQGAPGEHWTDRYVILGDLDRGRLVDKAFIEGTLDTFTWVEVDAPAGIIDDWPDHGS